MERGAAALAQEETDVGRAFAHDDRVGIREAAPIDLDGEVARGQPCERTTKAARKLIGGSMRTDRLANRKSQQVTDAHRRGEREGGRAADGDCVEIERNPHADHDNVIFFRIEELPAAEDK